MLIYIGTYQGLILILQTNLTQIKLIHSLKISQNSIKCIRNINNKYLIAGGYDQQLKIIDLQTYQEKIQAKQNKGQITTIQKLSNNKFVIGIDDGTLRLWNLENWSFIKQARFHKKYINSISAINQGKLLLTSGGNKIILWNGDNLRKAYEYNFGKDIAIDKLRVIQDIQDNKKFIFYNTSNNEIWKINTENNVQKLLIKMQNNRKIQDFIIYKGFIIVGNDIGQIMAWRYQQIENQNKQQTQNKEEKSINQKQINEKRIWFKVHQSRIKQFKIVLDQYLLVATASGNVSIWDFPQFLQTVEHVSQNYHLDGLKPLCAIDLKGRILCFDAEEFNLENQVNNGEEQRESVGQLQKNKNQHVNTKKSKKSQEKQKLVSNTEKNGNLNKKEKKKLKLKLKKEKQIAKNNQSSEVNKSEVKNQIKTKKIHKKVK